ncbi:hypothetical protein [Rhizobium tumorigenes]|uniref:hypothetical protein n=1 Tax=Rhizobium tumorigenes TaxID=2041385 RepID=UPI00241DC725|nr:hypothetical protein [Rhizobium tumorigenes]WFS01595.1 hypothetical protein PR016_02875 [Rhizobium tumorigenes]
MADKYKPAPGKRIPMPGNQADWPEEGRALDPLSGYENRLVADGDLKLVNGETSNPETPADAPFLKTRSISGGEK